MSTTPEMGGSPVLAPGPATKGRGLAVTSVVMVLVNLPWMLVSYFVGAAAMAVVDGEEGHLLTEYGAAGWVAWALMLAFMAVPSIVGVVLGLRARHLGEQGLATVGIVMNALVGAGWVALSAVQVVFG